MILKRILKSTPKEKMTGKIIGLAEAKSQLQIKRSEETFKNYLKSLKQEELQTEANFIMNSMGSDLDTDLLKKSAMLMEELAKRVSVNQISDSIIDFADSLKEQITLKTNTLH